MEEAVRVVPRAELVEPGQVLVARRTAPGRRPRFSSASWMPVARCSISRIRSVAQATFARRAPGRARRRRGRCRCRPPRCRPCPARGGLGPQFIHSMCEGASGSVVGDPPQAGEQLVDRGVRPHVVGGVAVVVGVGGVHARVEVRRAEPGTFGSASFARSRTGQVSSSASASRASSSVSTSTGPVTAISGSPSASRWMTSISSIARGTRGPISWAHRNTSSSSSIG